ncbi:SDR family NAD(P)-dependent oxidoreductase [Rhodococcoides yunnanense]|uniref:SDR family NAD(P)-dependent oxidoreductase n=1 Tax=Rhodococcoides yunnanense TaxID=278209 RepID=UPI0009334873|nr:SDR family NAD(P)-dependent oxidoreductase [Rhodococcus yunnanensis]
MSTIVITGGTDGIGRYLTNFYIARGDRVVVIGRNPTQGEAIENAGGTFLRVDLDSIEENYAAIDKINTSYPAIDALVFCARFYRSDRTETVDGIESTFAHFYLSRYLFGHHLAETLERSTSPVIVNVAGPGAPLEAANFDDLQLVGNYSGGAALGQGGKLNDLLGVSFAERHPGSAIRYALVHPGVTATAQRGQYDAATSIMVEQMRRSAKPIALAADPIIELIGNPPAEALSAFVEGRRVGVGDRGFDPGAARALDAYTQNLLDHNRTRPARVADEK